MEIFPKIFNGSLTNIYMDISATTQHYQAIFTKKLHHRYSTGSYKCLWMPIFSHVYYNFMLFVLQNYVIFFNWHTLVYFITPICGYNISTGTDEVQSKKKRTYRNLCIFDDEFLNSFTQLCLERRETHLVGNLLMEALYSNKQWNHKKEILTFCSVTLVSEFSIFVSFHKSSTG